MLQDLFTRGIDLNTNKLRPRYEDAPELYKESKLGMIPREWEVEKIGKIFRFNQGVQCPVELQKLHQGENEVRFIRIIDLTNEGEPPRYIADPGSQYHINSNDLFMVRYGSPGLVGYGYEGVIANNLFRIISTGELEILNSFYRYYLTSINDKLTALSASTTMPAINFDSLNKLHVIYPQIFEQVEIEKRIKAIDNKLQTEQNYLQKMQSLKKGLMEDLLCGKKQVKVAEEVLTQSEN
jgi:type I restriction enzyme S subunit